MARLQPVGAWAAHKVLRRVTRSIPFVGALVALAYVGHSVRRKGLVNGVLDSAIDAVPVIGACKTGLELLVTGEWFPDRPPAPTDSPPSR